MGLNLKIDNKTFNFINKAIVVMEYAHISSGFRLSGYFDRFNPRHRALFKPLAYRDIVLETTRGETLLTGTTLNNKFTLAATQRLATISGYTKTGILSDNQIPLSNYPLEFNGLTLLQIAQQLVEPFGLTVQAIDDGGAASEVIDEVTAVNSETISSFLTGLAAQLDLIITHDEFGILIITRTNTSGSPIANYSESSPATEISLSVNGQAMHSNLTVLTQTDIETDNAAEFSVLNPQIPIFRPHVRLQNIGNDNNTEEAAKRVRGNELRNIALTIRTDRWEWENNGTPEVMRPNNIITVLSPENFIFQRTNFFVQGVKLVLDEKRETAEIRCVLPETYNGEEPTIIFND